MNFADLTTICKASFTLKCVCVYCQVQRGQNSHALPCYDANVSFKQHSQCLLLLGGVADLCKYAADKEVFFLKVSCFIVSAFQQLISSRLTASCKIIATCASWPPSLHPMCSGGGGGGGVGGEFAPLVLRDPVCTPCAPGEGGEGGGGGAVCTLCAPGTPSPHLLCTCTTRGVIMSVNCAMLNPW